MPVEMEREIGGSDDHDHFMEKVRLVILGEATTLSTFFLKNNQLTKANYAQLSRLSSLILEDEDETELNEDNLVVDPLIKSLILLKSRLSKDQIIALEPIYIKPFCDVIVNKDVSGPITGLALQSILKFLNYGFIKDGEIVRLIGESVTKARFVGTDSSSDEVVLMRILSVLENLIVQPFYSLTNGLVCEIMQSCFRIAFETRLSELLRKCAIKSLTEMSRALFSRISYFDQDISDYNYFYQDKSNASFHKLNRMGRRFVNQNKPAFTNKPANKEDHSDNSDANLKNYGLACIHELLCYLTSLINPLPDGQNSDSMIQVGLNLLVVIFETAVQEIGSKYILLNVVKTDLCWNIMQLLQNEKNLNSFSNVLRLAFLVFVNLRMHLKYQFESILLRLMDIVTTMNAPLEFRDICIEHLLLLFRHIPFLPHELFFNFDCDPYSSNILEDLLQLFSKNCFTNSSNQNNNVPANALNFTTLQMLSFEALLSNLKSLQLAELNEDVVFTANPATMIVNISNIHDFSEKVLKEENNYNVCNDVKDIEEQQNALQQQLSEVNGDNIMPATDSNENASTTPPSELENFEHVHNSNGSLNEIVPQSDTTENAAIPTSTINKYCVTYLFPDSSTLLHTSQQIIELKHRKSLLWEATEKFNQKPSKGIEFLHENGLVANDDEIVAFLKNNPKVDKKQIGEYLSNKKNIAILTKFVQNFAFKDIRIDEALRSYLESFRLPGEAPLISLILEQFAQHWHDSNNRPFENEDAAFSLAYAIIMLNVDQHNTNAKRLTNSMTVDEFISNLRQVNGGKDFDRNMLSEIYYVIKNNEIIMPAEQTGVVREKYLWKCLLKNSETVNGIYWFNDVHFQNDSGRVENFSDPKDNRTFKLNIFNKPIFDISWGPSISTLTLVFDKLNPDKQPTLSRRVLNNGFTSYSLLCSRYGHLDDLVVNLSKFVISPRRITSKSDLVAHCLFGITKHYAHEMRTSWTNIIELVLFWYDNKLLDDGFEIEDFAIEGKKIKFSRKQSVKNVRQQNENANQSTFLSSFYSYFASNADDSDYSENGEADRMMLNESTNSISPSVTANSANEYCQALVSIIDESKFLHIDSLIELIKALINVEYCQDFDEDIEVFKLEILIKVILLNRDRLPIFWEQIHKHIVKLMNFCSQSEYLTERIISTIFRIAMIIGESESPDILWNSVWCPILQTISFFCCDRRRPVRTHAFTFLQRTLLLHDLNGLSAVQWESCFNNVLFPLLSKLLEPINMCDPIGIDEIRTRTTNLLCKVFLQHLHLLLTLNTFTALWLTILDFMDKYIKADMQSDLVKEAIPESLKNILLVMKTAGYFNDTLASITWDRINIFLPNLYQELMTPNEQQVDPIQTGHFEAPVSVPSEKLPTPANLETSPISEQANFNASPISTTPTEPLNVYSTCEAIPESVPETVQETPQETLLETVPVVDEMTNVETPIENSATQSPVSEELFEKSPQSELSQSPPVNYNIPSTFIDMESVCVYPEPVATTVTPGTPVKPALSFSHFPGSSTYPGTIAPFNPDGHSQSTTSYFNYISPDKTVVPGGTTYPWPMPNLSENPSLNK